jgi:hypothetical protein
MVQKTLSVDGYCVQLRASGGDDGDNDDDDDITTFPGENK